MSESEQNLTGQQINEEKLRRYLLGQCSSDESAEIERAAFRDNSLSDALSVIEDELTEDYVCEQLNDFDRSCFELKFLMSSERREKLRLSALLLNRAEVLRRVPPSFVRAHQLMSQETQEALGDTADSLMSELVTGGDRKVLRDALRDRMPGSIPIALGSTASRWKRWIALGAAAGVLFLILYGIRVRLAAPVKTTAPILNPTPSIASVTFRRDDQGLGVRPSESRALLVVKGENFTAGATVQLNGSNRETLFEDSNTLLAICPKTDIAAANAVQIRIVVVNPPPGGGPSPPFILTPTLKK